MTTYNWDLIERLLHEVQNGAGHSFTPRPYAGSTRRRKQLRAKKSRTSII